MENANKTNRLIKDLKTFEHLMKEKRSKEQSPEIEIEISEDEESPSSILLQASDVLLDCSMMVAKAAFLAGLIESEAENEKDEDEDACDDCPYDGRCGKQYGTMVLVTCPDGDRTIMTLDELSEEIGEISFSQTGTYDMKPVPETDDLYYIIPEKKPMKRSGKTYFRAPAVVFGIDEDAGEAVSPSARQLYAAVRYFEDHSVSIKTREGEVSVFCFE